MKELKYNHWYKVSEALPEDFYNANAMFQILGSFPLSKDLSVIPRYELLVRIKMEDGKYHWSSGILEPVAWMIPNHNEE